MAEPPLGLRATSRLLVGELRRAGVEVRVLDAESSLYEARLGDHVELVAETGGTRLTHAAALASSHKGVALELLRRAGVSVAESRVFAAGDLDGALAWAQRLGFPVVVKPVLGTNGDLVSVGLEDVVMTRRALLEVRDLRGPAAELLVEEHFDGVEHRVWLTAEGDYAVVRREPPVVLGDGIHSIAELAEAESVRRLSPRTSCLGRIVVDDEAKRHLRRAERSVTDVPAAGEAVRVRGNSNLSTGGMATDVTDDVHPTLIDVARRALAAFPGLGAAGLDILTTDARAPQTPAMVRVLEVNPLPGIGMHLAPGAGPSRDVARVLVEQLFPELRPAGRSHGAVPARSAPPPETRE